MISYSRFLWSHLRYQPAFSLGRGYTFALCQAIALIVFNPHLNASDSQIIKAQPSLHVFVTPQKCPEYERITRKLNTLIGAKPCFWWPCSSKETDLIMGGVGPFVGGICLPLFVPNIAPAILSPQWVCGNITAAILGTCKIFASAEKEKKLIIAGELIFGAYAVVDNTLENTPINKPLSTRIFESQVDQVDACMNRFNDVYNQFLTKHYLPDSDSSRNTLARIILEIFHTYALGKEYKEPWFDDLPGIDPLPSFYSFCHYPVVLLPEYAFIPKNNWSWKDCSEHDVKIYYQKSEQQFDGLELDFEHEESDPNMEDFGMDFLHQGNETNNTPESQFDQACKAIQDYRDEVTQRTTCDREDIKKLPIRAFALLMDSAKKGFAPAIYLVGQCYELSFGTPENLNLARKYYRRAAEDPQGCFLPGLLAFSLISKKLANCEGNLMDRAYIYLQIAADREHPQACYHLAQEIRLRAIFHKSKQLAFHYFSKAHSFSKVHSLPHHPRYAFGLACCYRDGFGTPKDLAKAFALYRISTDSHLPLNLPSVNLQCATCMGWV